MFCAVACTGGLGMGPNLAFHVYLNIGKYWAGGAQAQVLLHGWKWPASRDRPRVLAEAALRKLGLKSMLVPLHC